MDDGAYERKMFGANSRTVAVRDPAFDAAGDDAGTLLGEVVDWLGAPDWTGPQLPDDLARRIAKCLTGGSPKGDRR